jgi:hypothetical protein
MLPASHRVEVRPILVESGENKSLSFRLLGRSIAAIVPGKMPRLAEIIGHADNICTTEALF